MLIALPILGVIIFIIGALTMINGITTEDYYNLSRHDNFMIFAGLFLMGLGAAVIGYTFMVI